MAAKNDLLGLILDGWVDPLRRDGAPGPAREMRVRDPDGYCLMIAETAG